MRGCFRTLGILENNHKSYMDMPNQGMSVCLLIFHLLPFFCLSLKSGQSIIFHQNRFPRNKGISITIRPKIRIPTFFGSKSPKMSFTKVVAKVCTNNATIAKPNWDVFHGIRKKSCKYREKNPLYTGEFYPCYSFKTLIRPFTVVITPSGPLGRRNLTFKMVTASHIYPKKWRLPSKNIDNRRIQDNKTTILECRIIIPWDQSMVIYFAIKNHLNIVPYTKYWSHTYFYQCKQCNTWKKSIKTTFHLHSPILPKWSCKMANSMILEYLGTFGRNICQAHQMHLEKMQP